jgi:hypothetical protein
VKDVSDEDESLLGYCAVISLKLTDVSEMLTASIIALIMGAVGTSQTSGSFSKITWQCIPEGSHLYSRCRENLKSHEFLMIFT